MSKEPWTLGPISTEPLTLEKMKAWIERIKSDARFIPPCGSEDNPHLAAFDYESGALCAKCGTPLGQESNNQSGTETAQGVAQNDDEKTSKSRKSNADK